MVREHEHADVDVLLCPARYPEFDFSEAGFCANDLVTAFETGDPDLLDSKKRSQPVGQCHSMVTQSSPFFCACMDHSSELFFAPLCLVARLSLSACTSLLFLFFSLSLSRFLSLSLFSSSFSLSLFVFLFSSSLRDASRLHAVRGTFR